MSNMSTYQDSLFPGAGYFILFMCFLFMLQSFMFLVVLSCSFQMCVAIDLTLVIDSHSRSAMDYCQKGLHGLVPFTLVFSAW